MGVSPLNLPEGTKTNRKTLHSRWAVYQARFKLHFFK